MDPLLLLTCLQTQVNDFEHRNDGLDGQLGDCGQDGVLALHPLHQLLDQVGVLGLNSSNKKLPHIFWVALIQQTEMRGFTINCCDIFPTKHLSLFALALLVRDSMFS